MPKRKWDGTLAECVLHEKLEYLRSQKVSISQQEKQGSFDYLLDICLAIERLNKESSTSIASNTIVEAEADGEYDHQALTLEDISHACDHIPFVGPVRISALPSPKLQGVTATRDILKGELLCTSVPAIVVRNLAEVDGPESFMFSDLSRAEMTAKLIVKAEVEAETLAQLRLEFEYAGKSDSNDVRTMCELIIAEYTWAIDHPSTMPRGKKFMGKHTKVAGHAFTVSGFASKFNHSCVPNATMVSYGAVQFFHANCAIPAGTEICVSYGYDPIATVKSRREDLRIHAGFMCDCPLCSYQINHSKSQSRNLDESEDFEIILLSVLREAVSHHRAMNPREEPSLAKVHEALEVTAALMDGESDLPKADGLHALQLLTVYPKILFSLASSALDSWRRSIWKHCFLLGTMFLIVEMPRSAETGVEFGDLFRQRIQALAAIMDVAELQDKDEKHLSANWWKEKSLEYTDCF